MSWREEVFGPLRERNLENAQVHHLAETFDLSRDSRLAREIVRFTNATLDAEEKRRGVVRVRPGELVIRTKYGPLLLPLRTEEDIERALRGERWNVIRRDIVDRCGSRYRELFPRATDKQVEAFLRNVWLGGGERVRGSEPSPIHGPRQERPWGQLQQGCAELDLQRVSRWVARDAPRPGHRPETFAKLAHFLDRQAGIPPAVQEPMILDLMSIRARFCPRLTTLATGQMPLAAMHVETGRHLWQATRYQPLAPIVITVLAEDEGRMLRHHQPTTYEE